MQIGRDRLPELGQIGIPIADFQVAQDLVVGAVLLEDEDDMLHTGAHRRHDSRVAGALGEREAVVHGYLRGKRGQLRGGGAWKCLETGLQ